jgi:formylglycine-generating enzyme required for sulfatase activity
MKSTILLTVILVTILPVCVLANSAPVVSDVTATQRNDDSKLVDIYYNLADADGDNCTLWVVISDDGGQSWQVPAMTLTGHIGQGVTPGNGKHIIWDAGRDIPGKVGNYKARVLADDGKGPAPMVFVPAGNFLFSAQNYGSGWVYVNSFMIDKYEVTNAFYCEFLNSTDPCGINYPSSTTEIGRSGSYGNYYYTVNPGKENYPVSCVSYTQAEAFAQWRSSIQGGIYRLPTIQEWHKAAGWDPVLQKLWIYGFQRDSIDCSWCNYNGCIGTTTPVGYYNGTGGRNDAKSYYGCYDMSGNIWEWTTTSSSSWGLCGGSYSSTDDNSYANCAIYYWVMYDSWSPQKGGFRLVLVAE